MSVAKSTGTRKPGLYGRRSAHHLPELSLERFYSGKPRPPLPEAADVSFGITEWGMLANDRLKKYRYFLHIDKKYRNFKTATLTITNSAINLLISISLYRCAKRIDFYFYRIYLSINVSISTFEIN